MALWAKFWVDALDDPKLMRAERVGATQLSLLPWLIVWAKRAEDDGRLTIDGIPAEPEDIARSVPCVTPQQIATCIQELRDIGVLVQEDDGAFRFVAWEARCSDKPSDSPEARAARVRQHRQRKREQREAVRSGNALQGVTVNELRRDSSQPVGNATEHRPESLAVQIDRAKLKTETQQPRRQTLHDLPMSPTAPGPLPDAAMDLLSLVAPHRCPAVIEEMLKVLNGGLRHGRRSVKATLEQLALACATTFDRARSEPVDNPWAYALATLAGKAQASRGHVIQRPLDQTTAGISSQIKHAERWLVDHPEIQQSIAVDLEAEAEVSRPMLRISKTLTAWREAGAPKYDECGPALFASAAGAAQ